MDWSLLTGVRRTEADKLTVELQALPGDVCGDVCFVFMCIALNVASYAFPYAGDFPRGS